MTDKEIKRTKMKKKYKGLLFVAPWVIGFIIFHLIPQIYSIYMSMTDWGLVGPVEGFIGLENYKTALTSSDFWHSLSVTVRYALFAVPLTMLAGFSSALLLNTKVKGLGLFKAIYYLPVISSSVAIAVMWGWILSPEGGLMNMILGLFGIAPQAWLYDPELVIPSYVLIAVWSAFSGYLTYLVAMKEIPNSLYESSRILGMGYFERLRKVTIPLMRPILIYNLIMAITLSFRKFNEAYILGGAGGESEFYMVYFYQEAFGNYNMGYAVALAWILVFIVVGLMLIIYKKTPFWEYYSGTKSKKKVKEVK